jgi:hypothetical protein
MDRLEIAVRLLVAHDAGFSGEVIKQAFVDADRILEHHAKTAPPQKLDPMGIICPECGCATNWHKAMAANPGGVRVCRNPKCPGCVGI